MYAILAHLGKGLALTFKQILILLGPGLLLAFVMHHLSGFVRKRAAVIFGRHAFIWFTAPGTMVHELGHAFFCVVFGHRITEMQLFKPDERTGTLGYVNHSWNPESTYQTVGNFFIGTGPIWFGTAVIYLMTRYMLGPGVAAPVESGVISGEVLTSWAGIVTMTREMAVPVWRVFRNLLDPSLLMDWKFYLFVYLVFCIGSHVSLSPPDVEGASRGFGVFAGLLLLFNWTTLWIGEFSIQACLYVAQYCAVFYAVMLFALLINAAVSALVLGGSSVAGTARNRLKQRF